MQKRKFASNLVIILFFLLVGLAALFSDIFQTPVKTAAQAIEATKLFTSADLKLIKRISLKNKSGEYIFERKENNQISPWHMVAPRDISANSLFIENLFNALTVIKVKKLYPDETINYSNFSIDKPTATLDLIDENGSTIKILVGLMNSIDNSTYLKIEGRNGIYHVEAPSVSLENTTIFDLIESQIISIDLNNVNALKIFRNKKPVLEIRKKDGQWSDSEGNLLDAAKIDDFFQELSGLKSAFVLDRQTEAQRKLISTLTRSPEFTVSIEDQLAHTVEYNISSLTKSMPDLDFKNEEHFIVTLSNGPTVYVVKKEFQELFNKKADSLKKPF
ncbi:MAG: DUF4340 domain-containing protein [Bacteriovorax sp.]|jgi:hypothetical protein